ncbi:hypothetical protein E2C01_026741 [Portunus trituberculatus]|uniref:Uncharacterized protein n=1 Tax=Portunus trituberculatus TaxID=210409 RepID=A0A5B7EGW8_PORTR|nr:hypothetical protein [Portunus trituberculatus]
MKRTTRKRDPALEKMESLSEMWVNDQSRRRMPRSREVLLGQYTRCAVLTMEEMEQQQQGLPLEEPLEATRSDLNDGPREDEGNDHEFQPGREEQHRLRRWNRDHRRQKLRILGEEVNLSRYTQCNQTLRRFKASLNEHFRTGFDLVDASAQEHPNLQLKVRPNVKREVIITALNEESAKILATTNSLND